jgi:tetratricopeptide (TPR) repeat protein
MARSVLRLLTLAGIAVTLSACGDYGSMIDVFRGNLAYGRGDYQGALVHYMVAVDNEPSDAWTHFNIANVYYALGEHEAALEFWASARERVQSIESVGNNVSLLYSASFNRGVLLYQQGNYQGAYEEFRYALSVNSRDPDAKANLEIALSKLAASDAASEVEGSSGGVSLSDEGDAADMDDQTLRLLEYVRRKETQEWYANRDLELPDASQDW